MKPLKNNVEVKIARGQSMRRLAVEAAWLRSCVIFAILPLVLLIVAVPLAAQKALPEQQHIRDRVENAAREMGDDARVKKMSEEQKQDLVEFVTGNLLFVAFHEMGHALVGQLRLPVLGRGEDAADSFATLTMLTVGTTFSIKMLAQATVGWFWTDRRQQKRGNVLSFYDAHGLDRQRAYAIICLMVGSDDKKFKALADDAHMPEERQQTCHSDYDDAKYSWDLVLKPFLRSPDQPKSDIDVVYESGPGKLDVHGRTFRSIGFLETLAEYTSRRYVLPRPVTLVMKGCGDSNAWWDQVTLKLTLCYEMAEDFVELYQSYSISRARSRQ